MSFFTYILYSENRDRYYIGSTQDIEDRIERHLTSSRGFTSRAKDWELKYCEEFATREEAYARELQIKKWKSRKMIEKLIEA